MKSQSNAEGDALLAAVLAEPDDDAPRLVYADWLDENGRPERATFIRLQIELARLAWYDPRRDVLTRKATRLLDLYQDDWVAELPEIDGITWGPFSRGFVSGVTARNYEKFAHAADEILAVAPVDGLELRGSIPQVGRTCAHPRLRSLKIRFTTAAGRFDSFYSRREFFNSPILSTLRTLDLTSVELLNEGMAVLCRSPVLGELRDLILDLNFVGAQGVEALAESPIADRLTRLSIRGLSSGGFGADVPFADPAVRTAGVRTLANSHRFQNLEALDLSGNEIDGNALAALVESPHLVNLRELNLSHNDLTDDSLDVLTEEGWEMRLAHLDLSGNAIGDRGAAHLADADVLAELTSLRLDRCDLTARGVRSLVAADWFPGLRALSLNDNSIGPIGATVIAGTGTSLAELRIRGNEIGFVAAKHMVEKPSLAGLLILDVSRNEIGAAGLGALARSRHLTKLAVLDVARNDLLASRDRVESAISALSHLAGQLVWLRLDENDLGPAGLMALARCGEWSELAELGLRECGVNAPGLAYLADHGQFPALTRLALRHNAVDAIGVRALLQAPWVKFLTHLDLTSNQIGTEGMRHLAEADLGRLRWLGIEMNAIEAAGFEALAKSETLGRLRTVRDLGNEQGTWWQWVRDHFAGDEQWGDDLVPEGEIPF
jgi:uncharacterized protein (TIGR02996 family)